MEHIDRLVYEAIRQRDIEQPTIQPEELLAHLTAAHPEIPLAWWQEAAIRMYRKRSEELAQETEALRSEHEVQELERQFVAPQAE